MSRHDQTPFAARHEAERVLQRMPLDTRPYVAPAEIQPFLPLTMAMLWQVPVLSLAVAGLIVFFMVLG